MEITFNRKKRSVLNTIFIELEYMSGDADAYEYVQWPFEEYITYLNYRDHLPEIEETLNKFKILAQLTDDDSMRYETVLKLYGEEIAYMYDNVPGDSTNDGQTRAVIRNIDVCAYNEIGELLTWNYL